MTVPTTPARRITVSGWAGYWTASCGCGWVGTAHRSTGPLNARLRALREASTHTCQTEAR